MELSLGDGLGKRQMVLASDPDTLHSEHPLVLLAQGPFSLLAAAPNFPLGTIPLPSCNLLVRIGSKSRHLLFHGKCTGAWHKLSREMLSFVAEHEGKNWLNWTHLRTLCSRHPGPHALTSSPISKACLLSPSLDSGVIQSPWQ